MRGYLQAGLSVLIGLALVSAPALAAETPAAHAVEPVAVGSLLKVTFGLAAVLALIGVAAFALRRFGRIGGVSSGTLKLLGGLSMGARERVVLLQVGDTQLLVGIAPGSIRTLYVLDTPVAQQPPEAAEHASFAKWLKAARTAR